MVQDPGEGGSRVFCIGQVLRDRDRIAARITVGGAETYAGADAQTAAGAGELETA